MVPKGEKKRGDRGGEGLRPAVCSDERRGEYSSPGFELPQATASVRLDGVERAAEASHVKIPVGSEGTVGFDSGIASVAPCKRRRWCSGGVAAMRGPAFAAALRRGRGVKGVALGGEVGC